MVLPTCFALPWTSLADSENPPPTRIVPLSPLDGRYRAVAGPLVDYLSEAALHRYRLAVEVEWLIHLCESRALPGLEPLHAQEQSRLREIVTTLDQSAVGAIADIEKDTRHDVKAVEYYLQQQLRERNMGQLTPLTHFACTSEDINNLSYALGLKGAMVDLWLPAANQLIRQLHTQAQKYREIPMLARTHGQPATPTTLGKELAVLGYRLERQLKRLDSSTYLGKINGATGTYAAHLCAAAHTDWVKLSQQFVEKLELSWNPLTTQIEPHDWQAELYSDLARFNRILHNLCTDLWGYISVGYFVQQPSLSAVGSSTMPHKVNPIRFENAESNIELSCGLLDTLAATLVTSRWQRDLSDSSSQRSIGVALGHSLLAISNATAGLTELQLAPERLAHDLDQHWEVLGEAIQTVMRAEALAGTPGMENPYERLKEFTRGRTIDASALREFINSLSLPAPTRERLLQLEPRTYTGCASALTDYFKPDSHESAGNRFPR